MLAARRHHLDRALEAVERTHCDSPNRKADDPVQMYLNDIFTIAGNLTGAPGISIPCGFDRKGLPIGVLIQGHYFAEAQLLNIAHQFQLATDYHLKAPQ